MAELGEFILFLERLEDNGIYYKLNKVRNGIMAEIAVPGQRWEVEFMENGSVEVEVFISDGEIYGIEKIDALYNDFSD